jgi:hypothetical protein
MGPGGALEYIVMLAISESAGRITLLGGGELQLKTRWVHYHHSDGASSPPPPSPSYAQLTRM